MKIGFIGIGNMGGGMAAILLQAGHEVTVYNRTSGRARRMVEQGAQLARNVADACRGEVVITMLADDNAVEDVVLGEEGVLQGLRKGAIHLSMSTISVELSDELTELHRRAGQRYVAAPVFGRPDMAAAGKLFVVAGGPAETVEEVRPIFDAVGQRYYHVGEQPKHANLVKLSGNFLLASVIESLSEAMALISKAGMERHRYLEILTSSLFTGPVFTNYGRLVAEQKYEPAKFAAPLGEKDLRLTLSAAEGLRVPMPMASLLHDRLLTLVATGGAELDWSALGQLATKEAGLELAEK